MVRIFNKKLANLSLLPEKSRKQVVENAPQQMVKLPEAAQTVLVEKLADQAAKQAGSKLSTYIAPKSLAWWAGVASILIGIAPLFGINQQLVGGVGEIFNYLLGGGASSPSQFVILGLGLIGIRAKLSRLI